MSISRCSRWVPVAVCSLLSCSIPPAQAEELEYITVTATRTERDARIIPGTVAIVGEDQIERIVARDIRDLVRYEPGVSVSGGDRFGLNGFTIRGIGGDRVLTQVDGIPVADEFSFGPFLSSRRDFVDVDALKSVEIIRGPASSLYGSDALGGVVSFLTKDPEDYLDGLQRPYYFSVKGGGASDDDSWMTTGAGAGRHGSLGGLLLYTYRDGEETETHGGNDGTGPAREEADPLDYRSHSVLGKLVYDIDDQHRLRFTADSYQGDTDAEALSAVGTVVNGVLTNSSTSDDSRNRLRFSLDYEFDGDTPLFERALLRGYRQDSETQQDTLQERNSFGLDTIRIRDSTFEQEIYGFDLQFDKPVEFESVQHYIIYGADYENTDSKSFRDGGTFMAVTGAEIPEFNPLPTRDFPLTETRKYAVYLQDEISLAAGSLLLIPGVRYDHFEMNADSDAVFENGNPGVPAPEDFEDGQVSFKAGAIFRVTDVWSLYGQFTQGFRAPPYDDVNVGFTNVIGGYTTLPNSNLKPETSNSYEAGIRANGEAGSLSLAGYYNDYEDFIESLAVAGFNPVTGLIEFQSRNREEVIIKGIEFKGAWSVDSVAPALDGVRLLASAAWSRGQDKELNEPLNSVDPAKGVFGIYWSPSSASWNTQLVITAVNGKDRIDDTAAVTEFYATPGYVTLDLLGEYRFNEHLRINGGVFNLTDRKYREWGDVIGREYDDPALGRFTRPGLNASVSLLYVF